MEEQLFLKFIVNIINKQIHIFNHSYNSWQLENVSLFEVNEVEVKINDAIHDNSSIHDPYSKENIMNIGETLFFSHNNQASFSMICEKNTGFSCYGYGDVIKIEYKDITLSHNFIQLIKLAYPGFSYNYSSSFDDFKYSNLFECTFNSNSFGYYGDGESYYKINIEPHNLYNFINYYNVKFQLNENVINFMKKNIDKLFNKNLKEELEIFFQKIELNNTINNSNKKIIKKM